CTSFVPYLLFMMLWRSPSSTLFPYTTLFRSHLSNGRFVLGVGPGWDQKEFETLGMKLGERGRRTDEIIAALRLLLTERDVSFDGRYYRFQHVTIDPLPGLSELWVGGGSNIKTALSPDQTYLAPTVLARIAGADGWLARP